MKSNSLKIFNTDLTKTKNIDKLIKYSLGKFKIIAKKNRLDIQIKLLEKEPNTWMVASNYNLINYEIQIVSYYEHKCKLNLSRNDDLGHTK